ncbi:MAG: CoA transferase [Betaproteobacteria bacterium]|nr:CoA transferase [Betaproteobacteria bacterium]
MEAARRMALDGIRVVCFGMGGAAPLATATLGDFGAEIFKIEPRSGDWSRTTPGLGTREFNRNKKGIAIDLKHPDGIALARRMIAQADVVMESFRPGVMARLGLGYEAVREISPRIVYCSVSAYGQTGPWKDKPGVDGIIQAVSGIMSVLGRDTEECGEEDEPIKVSFPVADMTGGLLAVQGIMMALFARERYGVGQHVDVSLLEGALLIQKSSLTRYLNTRRLPVKTGSRAPYATPNEAYRTRDGYIMLAAYTRDRWRALCHHVLGRPELETDPRFQERPTRQEHHRELKAIMESILEERTSAEWMALCEEHDLICAPINTYREVVELEQVKARKAIDTIAFPDGRSMETVAVIPKLSETPGAIRSPYPAFIGQHTREILRSIGFTEAEIARLDADGVIGMHP